MSTISSCICSLTINERDQLHIERHNARPYAPMVGKRALQKIAPRQIRIVDDLDQLAESADVVGLDGGGFSLILEQLQWKWPITIPYDSGWIPKPLALTYRNDNIHGNIQRTSDVLVIGHGLNVIKVPANDGQALEQQRCLGQRLVLEPIVILTRVAGNDQEFADGRQQFFGQPLQMRTDVRLDFAPCGRGVKVQVELLLPNINEPGDKLAKAFGVILLRGENVYIVKSYLHCSLDNLDFTDQQEAGNCWTGEGNESIQ